MKPHFSKSFYCAAVIERPDMGARDAHCEVATDAKGNYTDSDEAVARWSAEVEAVQDGTRTFFSVYRVDGEGLSHVVGDFLDRDEARAVAALLQAGLQAPTLAGALDSALHQIEQMKGMFPDEDGTIAAALKAGYEVLQ